MGLWNKIKNGLVKALVVGAIGIKALLPSCGPVVPEIPKPTTIQITTPITTPIQNPLEIYLDGPNPYQLPVGDPIPKSVIDAYTVINNTGEDLEVKITFYDDPLNIGEGSIEYAANTRNYTTEEKRVTKRVYETEKLEDMLKTLTLIPNPNSTNEFYTVEEAIKNIPFKFPNGDVGFELPRGTNNNIKDYIEGKNEIVSGKRVNNLGDYYDYSSLGRVIEFSNQKENSIDVLMDSYFEYPDSVLTGYENGKVGIVYYENENKKILIFERIIIDKGKKYINRVSFPLVEAIEGIASGEIYDLSCEEFNVAT